LDGHIWGGEILALGGTCDPLEFERIWHLDEYWLPGGDTAQAAPWKCAVALLDQLGIDGAGLAPWEAAEPAELAVLRQLPAAAGRGLLGLVHRTSSAGRLFDAAAAILGVRQRVSYEAQAAMELEHLARQCPHRECAAWFDQSPSDVPHGGLADNLSPAPSKSTPGQRSGDRALDTPMDKDRPIGGLVTALVRGTRAGDNRACLARRFQAGLAGLTARALTSAAERTKAEVAGLTGGVFQNRLFTRDVLTALGPTSWPVLVHHRVPANDGGLALGQARAGHSLLTWQAPAANPGPPVRGSHLADTR
jgi:hydrogenase maturation protein HypF